jgi:hypothetical protein
MGLRAWDGAKSLAGKVWDTAKSWGSRAIDAAKRLGAAAWDRATALGQRLYDGAKDAAGKLLSIADKLTGGLASKVGGLAQNILEKASGLLSWVLDKALELANRALETAKSWAAKALEAAKSWGSRLWEGAKSAADKAWATAKSWAAKAWDTAKGWADKAWGTAKTWASKAVGTAKSWASKAWSTAKSWAGKAWSTAKTWAGKAWDTTKAWAGKAWDTVKGWAGKAWSGVKWLGGKAWGFAKSVGDKALDLAKTLGLDKAWNWVKTVGGKALDLARRAADALKKRLGPVLDVAKKVGEYVAKGALLLNPATMPSVGLWAACKTMACLVPKLITKGSTSQTVTDVATDVTPVVSTAKDACGCLTGENMVTGEEIGGGGRAVRCTVAVIDIASYVGALFSGGGTAVGEQAAKGVIRAWLERLLKIGGKELAEAGEKQLAKQFAKMTEKEFAEALAKMGETELKELAEQAAKAGEKELAEKAEKELAKRVEAAEAGAKEIADEGLKAKAPTADGGEVKITKDGRMFVCASPCIEFRAKYGKVLDANPGLEAELRKIETEIADATEQSKALADLKLKVEAAAKVSDPIATAQKFGLQDVADHGGLLIGRLSNGAEVALTFSKVGDNLAVNIVAVFNPKKTDVLGSLLTLYKGAFRAAKAEGVGNVTIRAAAVVNKELEKRLTEEGWHVTKVMLGDGSVVDAFERTFPVR